MRSIILGFKQIIVLLFLSALFSCGNANSGNDKVGDKTTTEGTVTVALPTPITADTLEKENADGNSVLLVITGTGATSAEDATTLVNAASARISNSAVYSMNRDLAANSELVNRFGIATVPLPFILVVSAKGIPIIGGQPNQLTAEKIVNAMPSPKQDEVYAALNEKKPVFIVVSQKDYTDKESILAICKTAASRVESKPAVVEVDFDDPHEKAFLAQMGVKVINGATITVVSNASGQITATFTKKPTINELIQAAAKVIKQSGCAPGGCATPC